MLRTRVTFRVAGTLRNNAPTTGLPQKCMKTHNHESAILRNAAVFGGRTVAPPGAARGVAWASLPMASPALPLTGRFADRPYLISTLSEGEFDARIASPQGRLAPRESFVMQRMNNSNFRYLWRRAQALANLRQGSSTHANKKIEGRSEEVVENTRPLDFMPAKKSDFACEITEFYANCTSFFRCFL